MHPTVWLEFIFYLFLLVLLTPLLGTYMAKVLVPRDITNPWFRNVEQRTCNLLGIDLSHRMNWIQYAQAVLIFNAIGFFFLFAILTSQGVLPWNPQGFPNVPWPLAFNITASFVTNTNWQSYAGETTLSYFSQMMGLTVQNFLSAATGMAVLLALIRGIKASIHETLGNFWSDVIRVTLFLLLPLSLLLSIILIQQGVVQTLHPYVEIETIEHAKQTIPLGPAASQIAIKQLGTNGGGFFSANSSHPFENPTPLTNSLEMFAILLIPAATTYTYGLVISSKKQGWLIFLVMLLYLVGGLALALASEIHNYPNFDNLTLMEGKETRHGVIGSILWAISTSGTSNGSVNAMLDSLTPLASGISLFNLMLTEIIFGGVGVGLCCMIKYVFMTVFLSGLMVGRTPEYQGKKIEKREIQWVMAAILIPSACILLGTSLAIATPGALKSVNNAGPHGLTQLLYGFASASVNNGSAMGGLEANTIFYNLTLGLIMLLCRLAIIIPSLGLAGCLVKKKIIPPSLATFDTSSMLFGMLLVAVIFIVGSLTFFPALSLGPIMEHLLMLRGKTF